MVEDKILDENEIHFDSITDSTDVRADTEVNNSLARAVVGGVVGAFVGTVAVALANKKTADNINHTVKGLGDVARGATEGLKDTVKNRVNTVKDVAFRFKKSNNKDSKNTDNRVDNDLEKYRETTEAIVKDNKEDVKSSDKQDAKTSENQVFALYEERLIAKKKQVKTSEVSIGKHIETHVAHISVPVEKERLVIQQIPIDNQTPVASGEANFREGELARLEIYEQNADIEKQAFVREKVNIRKEVEYTTLEIQDKIRREELDLEVQDSKDIKTTSN